MDGPRFHLVGAAGDGMAPLASLLLELGAEVSGSDLRWGRALEELVALGARISLGHRPENPDGADAVIYSSAIPQDNPELVEARRAGIPAYPRLHALKALLSRRRLIAVCGTHGKTTTSAWISYILRRAGLQVGFYIGAEVRGFPRASWGSEPWFVAEVDESDGLFLGLQPEIAVLTNVDRDHLGVYRCFRSLAEAFGSFLYRARLAVFCGDDPVAREISKGVPSISYGLGRGCAVWARNPRPSSRGTSFEVFVEGRRVGETHLPLFGRHNVLNALAALAVAWALGARPRDLLEFFPELPRPARRLELFYENGLALVDDYAHHPREIAVGLEALRSYWPGRRIIALFQPHRYSRTSALHWELGAALTAADLAVVAEIYPAFEDPIPGVSGRLIVDRARALGGKAVFVPDPRDAAERAISAARDGDVVVCFGAGDVWVPFRRMAAML